jgi:predicted secreted protein
MRKYGKDTKSIRVNVGERFVLELPAAATAGFTWSLRQNPELATVAEERIRPSGPGIGAASVQEFELAAVRVGVSRLELEYKRPWENVTRQRLEMEIVVGP